MYVCTCTRSARRQARLRLGPIRFVVYPVEFVIKKPCAIFRSDCTNIYVYLLGCHVRVRDAFMPNRSLPYVFGMAKASRTGQKRVDCIDCSRRDNRDDTTKRPGNTHGTSPSQMEFHNENRRKVGSPPYEWAVLADSLFYGETKKEIQFKKNNNVNKKKKKKTELYIICFH